MQKLKCSDELQCFAESRPKYTKYLWEKSLALNFDSLLALHEVSDYWHVRRIYAKALFVVLERTLLWSGMRVIKIFSLAPELCDSRTVWLPLLYREDDRNSNNVPRRPKILFTLDKKRPNNFFVGTNWWNFNNLNGSVPTYNDRKWGQLFCWFVTTLNNEVTEVLSSWVITLILAGKAVNHILALLFTWWTPVHVVHDTAN